MAGRRRRATLAGGLALAAVLVLAGCSGAGSPSAQNASDTGFVPGAGTVVQIKPADRKAAPALEGPRVGGGTLSLASYRGRVVVLNVWGSWCAPCRAETPALVRSANTLAKQGVSFVGLNTRDNDAAAAAFDAAFHVPYPSFYDPDGDLVLMLRGSVSPKGIPSTLVIDRQGRVAAVVVGGATEQELSAVVGDVLLETLRPTAAPGAPAGSATAAPTARTATSSAAP